MTLFDAGARTMTRAVARARARSSAASRGSCSATGTPTIAASRPALGVPVLCHPDEVQDAEGSGGWRYWPADLAGLPPVVQTGPESAAPLRLGRRPGDDLGHRHGG